MDKAEIYIGDIKRILFGTAPETYLFEVAIRVALLYLVILMAVRVMGPRMTAKLGRGELAARVGFGAAVGMAMVRPGRGVLLSIIIVLIIIGINKILLRRIYASRKFEKAYQGELAVLVRDGVIDHDKLKDSHVSKNRLFAALRQESILHLGQVNLFCIEANGEFSLLKSQKPVAGISVIPKWDIEFRERQKLSGELFCERCGRAQSGNGKCVCGCWKMENGIEASSDAQ